MTWTHTFRLKKGGVAYLAGTTHPDLLCSQWNFSGLRQMVWHSYSKEVLAIVKIAASVWLHSMSHYAWKTLKNSWNAFLLVLLQYMSLFPFSWHWITLLANYVSCKIENILSWCLKSCCWKFPSWFLVCVFPEGMSEIKQSCFWFLRHAWLQCLSIVHSLNEEFSYVIQPVLYSVLKVVSANQSCCRDRGQALPLSLNTT